MRRLLIAAAVAVLAGPAVAEDNKPVELSGMKSTPPAEWKTAQPGMMRSAQFSAPKADGDSEDGEVSVFTGQAGGVDPNVARQVVKFKSASGGAPTEKKDKIKVGTTEAVYQDLTGTYTPRVGTPKAGYRQLYVIFEGKDGLNSVWLLGPEKTVEKHKKGFEEWLKNFK